MRRRRLRPIDEAGDPNSPRRAIGVHRVTIITRVMAFSAPVQMTGSAAKIQRGEIQAAIRRRPRQFDEIVVDWLRSPYVARLMLRCRLEVPAVPGKTEHLRGDRAK